ncbi:MAG: InlB B-repeat-containing protein, partial [Clostridia bacterium]|nr:InlB B-repeat-containing protein [Clostridia bacterium]
AVWTPITYTIKYNAGEGEYTGSLPNSKPEWLQLKNAYTYDSAVTLYDGEDFERTGYTLTGWEIGGTKYDLGETVEQNFTKVQSGTVQAYAVWEPIGYTLRFNADTGLINGKRLFTTSPNYIVTDNMSLEEIFAWENEAGFIDSPDVEVSKEGYELKYWYCTANNKIKVYPGGKFDIGTFVENGCDVNEDGIPMIKFKAVWDASDVTVEYTFATEADRELPSEVTALVPVDENVYHAGDIVTVPTLAATTVETEEGTWTFVDWNLKEGATEFTVQPKDAENGILITGYWSFTEKVEEPETEEEPKPEKPEPKFDMPKLNLRSIVIDTTEGGKTSVASGRCYGALGSTYRLAITPDEGFEIDEVLVNGKPAEVNKNNKASFVVKGNTYVEVSFVEIEG